MSTQYHTSAIKQESGKSNQDLGVLWASADCVCQHSIEAIYQVTMTIPQRHEHLRRMLVALALERSRVIETPRLAGKESVLTCNSRGSVIQDMARNYNQLGWRAVESRQGIAILADFVLFDRVSIAYLRNAIKHLPLNKETIEYAGVVASLQMNSDRIRECWADSQGKSHL